MDTIVTLIMVISAISVILTNFHKLFPARRRKAIIGAVGEFADSENGKKFSSFLTATASLGILIEGFMISLLIVCSIKSVVGIYSGLGAFIAFALFALYIMSIGRRK